MIRNFIAQKMKTEKNPKDCLKALKLFFVLRKARTEWSADEAVRTFLMRMTTSERHFKFFVWKNRWSLLQNSKFEFKFIKFQRKEFINISLWLNNISTKPWLWNCFKNVSLRVVFDDSEYLWSVIVNHQREIPENPRDD